jgi:bifunctional ADP-heptose synthase (sugar kinase/adenylyltransferase)
MLSTAAIECTLGRLPTLHIGVVGDLFLDRYLDLDSRLTEPSLETGLDAYQVTRVRSCPGAAGTILNNLVALGVGHVSILSVIGEDGEGFELRRELERRGVDQRFLIQRAERFTPTYTKPMLHSSVQPARELNRIDIKNRTPLPRELEDQVLGALPRFLQEVGALLILDQVSEPECGVITSRVRTRLGELGALMPGKFMLADSRERIGQFQHVAIKPNEREVASLEPARPLEERLPTLAERLRRPVFCTCGQLGILLAEPTPSGVRLDHAPAFRVKGPIDPVGAGDSVSAGIACAVAAGLSNIEAAAFGNLIASITIQQIGTTGTATLEQVRERWREVEAQQKQGVADA